jgi:hypothetical protein
MGAAGFIASEAAGAVWVAAGAALPAGCVAFCAKAAGARTDAVAKIAPAAADVRNLPVIVNLPFIQMADLALRGVSPRLTITEPVRKMNDRRHFWFRTKKPERFRGLGGTFPKLAQRKSESGKGNIGFGGRALRRKVEVRSAK